MWYPEECWRRLLYGLHVEQYTHTNIYIIQYLQIYTFEYVTSHEKNDDDNDFDDDDSAVFLTLYLRPVIIVIYYFFKYFFFFTLSFKYLPQRGEETHNIVVSSKMAYTPAARHRPLDELVRRDWNWYILFEFNFYFQNGGGGIKEFVHINTRVI